MEKAQVLVLSVLRVLVRLRHPEVHSQAGVHSHPEAHKLHLLEDTIPQGRFLMWGPPGYPQRVIVDLVLSMVTERLMLDPVRQRIHRYHLDRYKVTNGHWQEECSDAGSPQLVFQWNQFH